METVKIGEDQKRRREELLAKLIIERDKNIPFHDALGKVVDHAIDDAPGSRMTWIYLG